jgi:hypothetical protein
LATTSTSDLRLQKTMPFFTSSRSIRARSAVRLALGSAVGMRTMFWVIVSAVVAGREASMRIGSSGTAW